jgi:hypothetical protein
MNRLYSYVLRNDIVILEHFFSKGHFSVLITAILLAFSKSKNRQQMKISARNLKMTVCLTGINLTKP